MTFASNAALAAALLCATTAALAVDFAVPVEAAGLKAAVKSIRLMCQGHNLDGTIAGRGFAFVAVAGGAINQTVHVTVDIPLGQGKGGYACRADRAFEVDVTKLNPIPGSYYKADNSMTQGLDIKQINLQANSVVQVGGKL